MTAHSRRSFLRLGGAAATALLAHPAGAVDAATASADARTPPPGEYELMTIPSRIFKIAPDANREHMEGWFTTFGLKASAGNVAEPERLEVSYRQGDAERVSMSWNREALKAMNLVPADAGATARAGPRFAMRLTSLQPRSLGIDRAHCELVYTSGTGERLRVTADLTLETYQQKASLIFPFRGPGIITQGGALNDGHRNRSGQFAVDAMALSKLYAVMGRDGDSSDSVFGWGQPILAPAAGEVVVARSDRPDQPVLGNSDPKYFFEEFPDGGDPGNHVVIDHGQGEFSMIAHFQKGSLTVKAGARVTQGQRLGLLGTSGDTNSPHVHHQLQSGPDWTKVDGLPHHYQNGPERRHDRGAMFNAK
jgi:hypothetical protein